MPLQVSDYKDREAKPVSQLEPGWHKALFAGIVPYKNSDNHGMFFDMPDYKTEEGYSFSVSKTLFANSNFAVSRHLVNNLLITNGFKPVEEGKRLPPLPFHNEDEIMLFKKHMINLKLKKKSNGYWEIVETKPGNKVDKKDLVKYGLPEEDENDPPF